MGNKKKLTNLKLTLTQLSEFLNGQNCRWILGGSCALILQGVDVIPHDIDIFVDDSKLSQISELFSQNIIEPIHSYLWKDKPFKKFKMLLNNIEIEIIELHQDQPKSKTTKTIIFYNQPIIVYNLKYSLEFYQSRPGKETVVELIKEKLKKNKLD